MSYKSSSCQLPSRPSVSYTDYKDYMIHNLHDLFRKAFLTSGTTALLLCAGQATSAQEVSTTVTLAWNANPEPGITGYRLYYGNTSRTYTQTLDVGNSTVATVSGLQGGTPYFFATTAYNTLGLESTYSNEVAYTTPSQTPTPTPGPTATPVGISGTISYCSDPLSAPVPNVTLTLAGSGSGSTLSDASGNYQFRSLVAGGSYTVTPTKSALPPGSAGINTVDVIAVQRHFLNFAPLPFGCRRTAADVNGDTLINTADLVAIQRFALGLSIGIANTGKYLFTPASRAYLAVVSNQTGQNYDTLVFGDVAAGFVYRPEDPLQSAEADGRVEEVALPEVVVDQFVTDFLAEVTTTTISAADNLVGFQCDFTFDSSVVTFQSPPVSSAGLTDGNWNVSGNVLPGEGPIRTLRISAYSNDFTPLSGSGTLFNLNMTRVSSTPGAFTALTWEGVSNHFIFIDTDLNTQAPREAVPGEVILP
jgi:hypothetical protein